MNDQLPESRRYCETQKALKVLRDSLARKNGKRPLVSVMLKVPADVDEWLKTEATAQGFDNRQGFLLNLIRSRMPKKDVG